MDFGYNVGQFFNSLQQETRLRRPDLRGFDFKLRTSTCDRIVGFPLFLYCPHHPFQFWNDILNSVHVVGVENGALVFDIEGQLGAFLGQADQLFAGGVSDGQFVHHVRVQSRQVGNGEVVIQQTFDDLSVDGARVGNLVGRFDFITQILKYRADDGFQKAHSSPIVRRIGGADGGDDETALGFFGGLVVGFCGFAGHGGCGILDCTGRFPLSCQPKHMQDLAGLSEPLKRLVDVTASAIGLMYEPTHVRRMAKARAEEMRLLSDATREVSGTEILTAGYQSGAVTTWASAHDLTGRSIERIRHVETKRQSNIETIADIAAETLVEDVQLSSARPDDDWVYRFFKLASEVNSTHMQNMWGKILAGEIINPGCMSVRSLELLSRMSQSEVKLFEKLAQSVVRDVDGRYYVIIPKRHLGLSAYECQNLEALGLFSDVRGDLFGLERRHQDLFLVGATHRYFVRVNSGRDALSCKDMEHRILPFAAYDFLPFTNISTSNELIMNVFGFFGTENYLLLNRWQSSLSDQHLNSLDKL